MECSCLFRNGQPFPKIAKTKLRTSSTGRVRNVSQTHGKVSHFLIRGHKRQVTRFEFQQKCLSEQTETTGRHANLQIAFVRRFHSLNSAELHNQKDNASASTMTLRNNYLKNKSDTRLLSLEHKLPSWRFLLSDEYFPIALYMYFRVIHCL